MIIIILVGLLGVASQGLYAECVPARTVVKYPDEVEKVGMYHRVHPSGNYILATDVGGDSRVVIIDLTGKDMNGKTVPRVVETPMQDEAYPVEGNWSLIASPNHGDGMRYYKFSDLLKHGNSESDKKDRTNQAEPVMTDPDHNRLYHSCAELPGSTKEEFKFRTMLWKGSRYRDYTIIYNKDGTVKETKKTETKTACGKTLLNPILSKDGTEVATTSKSGTTQIYKIKEDGNCELIDDLGYFTSKVNFSYPKNGSKGQVVFWQKSHVMINGKLRDLSGVYLYDRDTKTTHRISHYTESSEAYPGMTSDGRVVYINSGSREIVTVDPNQLNPDGTENADKSKCIHKAMASKTTPSPVNSNKGSNQ